MTCIVVAGLGPVGTAVSEALSHHPDVEVYLDDPYKGENLDFPSNITVDGVVVCVATPMSEDGSCYVDNIVDVFKKYGSNVRYLIRSTTNPLFLREFAHLDITFSPEYIRGTTGANPTKEFLDSEFAIYGGGSMRWWHEIFVPILTNLKTVRFMTAEQASFAKYFLNGFLATKVTFFNQAYEIYEACGGKDFDVVIDGLCLDPRVGLSHTQVPGPDNQFGYGGHCFPKDMAAFAKFGEESGANVQFLKDTIAANDRNRSTPPFDLFLSEIKGTLI
jgi:UDP-glucose 6-dehydrogenase